MNQRTRIQKQGKVLKPFCEKGLSKNDDEKETEYYPSGYFLLLGFALALIIIAIGLVINR